MNFDRRELKGTEMTSEVHPLAGRLQRFIGKARDSLIASQLELLAHLADLAECDLKTLAKKLHTSIPNVHQRIKGIARKLGIGGDVKKGAPIRYVYAVALGIHGKTERALSVLQAIEGVPVRRAPPVALVPVPPQVDLPEAEPLPPPPEAEPISAPPEPEPVPAPPEAVQVVLPPPPPAPVQQPAAPVVVQAASAPMYGPGVSLELPDPQSILELEVISGVQGDRAFANRMADCRRRGLRPEQLIAYPTADPQKTLTLVVMVLRQSST